MDNASEELAQYSKNIRAKVLAQDLVGLGLEFKTLELKVLDYLFEEPTITATKDTHMTQLLCVHEQICLSRQCLLTAGPYKLMDAMIIDAVGIMLTLMQRKKYGVLRSWYLPTWVQQFIARGDDFGDIWDLLSFYTGPLNECEKIYIPINEDNIHWYLLVVSAPDKGAFYVDTCKDNFKRRWDAVTVTYEFVRHITNSTAGNLGRWETMDSWYLVELAGLPDQAAMNDRVNCGAYVVHFMLHPKEVPNVTPRTVITAKNRMRLMASLILWEENAERQAIVDYVNIIPMISEETSCNS